MYDIRTIDELVALLGGDTVVADWLGISQGAVGNWKQRRFIPPGWHMRLLAETRRRGKTIDPEVFGMHENDWAALFGSDQLERDHACSA
jgi:hypothetical protein